MVLLRVELQELLHADVGEAEGVGAVLLVGGGVDLRQQGGDSETGGRRRRIETGGRLPSERERGTGRDSPGFSSP